jgi:hypothetical protein
MHGLNAWVIGWNFRCEGLRINFVYWFKSLCVFPGWCSSVGESESSRVGVAHRTRYCDTRSYFLNGKRHCSLFLRRGCTRKVISWKSITVSYFSQLFGQHIRRKINSTFSAWFPLSLHCFYPLGAADDGRGNKLHTYQRGPFNPYLCLRTAQRRTNLISGFVLCTHSIDQKFGAKLNSSLYCSFHLISIQFISLI